MNATITALRAAAERVLDRMTGVADKLRAKERADINGAAREKSQLPEGYWEARHKADRLQDAARRIYDALGDREEGEEK